MRPLHYALKYGQGGELCYPDTWLQTKDVSSTLLPETMVPTPGFDPSSVPFQGTVITRPTQLADCIEARLLYRVVSWCQPMQPDRHLTMPVKLHPQNLVELGRLEFPTSAVQKQRSTSEL